MEATVSPCVHGFLLVGEQLCARNRYTRSLFVADNLVTLILQYAYDYLTYC